MRTSNFLSSLLISTEEEINKEEPIFKVHIPHSAFHIPNSEVRNTLVHPVTFIDTM